MSTGTKELAKDVAPWAKGDELTAEKLNEGVRAINDMRQRPQPPQQVKNDAPGYGKIYQFKVASIQGDYLTCNPYDGVNAADAGVVVYIAKPFRLRPVTSRNGVTYSAYSSDSQQRTATQSSTTETQLVTPSYLAGDVIYAVRGVIGKLPLNASSAMIEHLDLNTDGRAWAKQ